MQVIYPFIDSDTKGKFCFVPGNAKGETAQKVFSKNFDLEQLEEVGFFFRPLCFWLLCLLYFVCFRSQRHLRVRVRCFVSCRAALSRVLLKLGGGAS